MADECYYARWSLLLQIALGTKRGRLTQEEVKWLGLEESQFVGRSLPRAQAYKRYSITKLAELFDAITDKCKPFTKEQE